MSTLCAACGGADVRHHLSVKAASGESLVANTTAFGVAPSDLVRCALCGHIQVAELPPHAELEEAYAEVDESAYLEEERGQRATARRSLEAIERRVDRGSICDLGCWVGFLLSEAEGRGWRAQGVEPSRFAADYARRQFGLSVQNTTLDRAELPAESFEAVVLADVLEHLPDPGATLDRVRALLRPGGVLLLALPDSGSLVARALGARWWSVIPTHVQYFTRPSLTLLLGRHGFTVERVDTAPKAFTVRYYLSRLEGYSGTLARAAMGTAERLGVADCLVWPDFRDRMEVIARRGS
ncbi:MAG TPA: class I SAM-dependent methyltransferase [Thermoleophilaceae bacterium]|nr:class I SAM-dependent methyltransferase [Thermoleophilaceae bacterium]